MPAAWSHAMSTPFQWTKLVASHFGGTRNALAISWPKRIKDQGGLRQQFHHVIDILPTMLEAAQIPAPVKVNGFDQKPIEGVSMVKNYRTQFKQILAKDSADKLIEILREKVKKG